MSTAPDVETASRAQRRIHLISTVLLSLATLATAWAPPPGS
jgi:hypothetical protein